MFLSANTWLLLRVWKRQRVKYYGFTYTRKDDPFNFWLSISLLTLSLIWWSALAIVVVVSAIWGPLFHQ
jgi:hypothetical protein